MIAPVLVRDANGVPQPPQEIVRGLCNIDPHLSVSYHAAGWRILWKWPMSDRRWERVQKQEVAPESAYDIVGWVPANVPLDQVPSYVERCFRTWPADEVRKLADRVNQYNQNPDDQVHAVEEATQTAVIDFATERASRKSRRPRSA